MVFTVFERFFLLGDVLGRVEAEKLTVAVFCRFAPTTIKKMIVLSSYISPFRPQRGNILAGWERLKARTSLAFIFDDGFVSLHQIPFVLSNIETNTKFVFFPSLKICLGLSQRGKKFSLTRAKLKNSYESWQRWDFFPLCDMPKNS